MHNKYVSYAYKEAIAPVLTQATVLAMALVPFLIIALAMALAMALAKLRT
jgi:hypothetical protein